VDVAQAALGVARATVPSGELNDLLVELCRDLYVVMAELATLTANADKLVPGKTAVTESMVKRVEDHIDAYASKFSLPTEFSIPGSNPTSASLDMARTIIRRAERESVSVSDAGSAALRYLNRLSDLIWTLARWHEDEFTAAKPSKP